MLFSMYIRSIQGYRQKEYNMLFSMYIRSIQGYRHRNICYLVCRKVVFRDIDRRNICYLVCTYVVFRDIDRGIYVI